MAPEMDQFYRSTMAIYKSIMEQFNPALENLVYLGNNYLRAFHALSEAAEVYFSAIQKIGEQALQSSTSQILGEMLVQMSDTQRHLNSDLEVVVQTFHGDLLQHMEKNTKLDVQFLKDSRQHYEIEYRHRAANLEQCRSELWRMERKRDKNTREMKESVNRLHAQMQAFVSESQRAAELEEKRRYRFLAEKHLLLSSTLLKFFGRVSRAGRGQPRPPELAPPRRRPSSPTCVGIDFPLSPSLLVSVFIHIAILVLPRAFTKARAPRGPRLFIPEHMCSPLTNSSVGGFVVIVHPFYGIIYSHSDGANHTLLRFSAGDVLEVLVPQAQNGWLYGKLEGSSASGWFPEAYVKPLEEAPMTPLSPMTAMDPMSPVHELSSRSYPLRGSHSLDDLLDRPGNSTTSPEYWDSQSRSRTPSRVPSRTPSPAPSPLPGSCRSSMGAAGDVEKLLAWEQHPPELFPRGTNPFATVKLRPTVTNDRSAPLIH
ncbi:brain-specific angiogenesis inhibitor 1-associated protein 2-like protein 2 [Fukomys damarensis]|uniref:brain-specific angiogenesis inhibitor 1-associated protein 2-like protein 2 n=1 Tax=Fukomys damarensis TaxID=885580 RepID=UPI0008FED502|nr:brain-specific angiogenesis inhibitor 1-associated protein 2-like protein 2 [Fukomys damarensis]